MQEDKRKDGLFEIIGRKERYSLDRVGRGKTALLVGKE